MLTTEILNLQVPGVTASPAQNPAETAAGELLTQGASFEKRLQEVSVKLPSSDQLDLAEVDNADHGILSLGAVDTMDAAVALVDLDLTIGLPGKGDKGLNQGAGGSSLPGGGHNLPQHRLAANITIQGLGAEKLDSGTSIDGNGSLQPDVDGSAKTKTVQALLRTLLDGSSVTPDSPMREFASTEVLAPTIQQEMTQQQKVDLPTQPMSQGTPTQAALAVLADALPSVKPKAETRASQLHPLANQSQPHPLANQSREAIALITPTPANKDRVDQGVSLNAGVAEALSASKPIQTEASLSPGFTPIGKASNPTTTPTTTSIVTKDAEDSAANILRQSSSVTSREVEVSLSLQSPQRMQKEGAKVDHPVFPATGFDRTAQAGLHASLDTSDDRNYLKVDQYNTAQATSVMGSSVMSSRMANSRNAAADETLRMLSRNGSKALADIKIVPESTTSAERVVAALLGTQTTNAGGAHQANPASAAVTDSGARELSGAVHDQVMRNITRQALAQGRLTIQLNPRELGALDIEFSQERGELQVAIVARESVTRDLLEVAMPRLRQSLQDAGISVGDLDVRQESKHDQQHTESQKRPQQKALGNAEGSQIDADEITTRSSQGLFDVYV